MTLHLSRERSSSSSSGGEGANGGGSSSGSSGNGQLSRQEQREVLSELMASKAVQSQIPYWCGVHSVDTSQAC